VQLDWDIPSSTVDDDRRFHLTLLLE